jgi:saccharopine dehydrogenase-like NADP-dependent oxidoreductase
MQNTVLLFGAGKSATVLIEYLIKNAKKENWLVQVVDANLDLVESKTKKRSQTHAFGFNIETDVEARQSLIANAAIVISLLPPHLHILVAKDCITYQRNLLTASYIDEATKALIPEIEENKLLFLYEMGLDPGIDHMSAMQIIDSIHAKGGIITSFKSHCGGLVAPENDDNPWNYKISWNPKNVVMAGKAGAIYKENNEIVTKTYSQIFEHVPLLPIATLGTLSYYPNRDSLSYIDVYGLQTAHTFLRTTLRYPMFMYGWQNVLELQLTNEEKTIDTKNKNLQECFNDHLIKNNFGEWAYQHLGGSLKNVNDQVHNFGHETEKMTIDNSAIDLINNEEKLSNIHLKQMYCLGINDKETMVNKGMCSPADILQIGLEKHLALGNQEKDMIVMLHEIEYELNNQKQKIESSLIVIGKDNKETAMAKTVGLPLGIAAKLILNGTIIGKGLTIPIDRNIYEPVLASLNDAGIVFNETHRIL